MPLKIAIVGAGIGGPAAAIGLARNGHEVTIYERASTTDSVGFAFRVMPNADRCLKFLGIDTEVGGAVAANTSLMLDEKGNVAHAIRENQVEGDGGVSVFAYRPNLHRQLLDTVVAAGVQVKTGLKVSSVDTSQTTLHLDDGTVASADLIIAADGIHSCIRRAVLESNDQQPRPSTGHSCLRFTIPKQKILDDPITSRRIKEDFRMFSWMGDRKHIIVYPVDFDTKLNFSCTHPMELSAKETSGEDDADAIAYNHKISLGIVKDIYKDFDPVAIRLLELADPDGFRVWKLMDTDEFPRWSRGNTVLLGDACHPVLPFGFSGAAMAIEDAATLAVLLPADAEVNQIPDRLRLYEDLRRPRVARVRDAGRVIGSQKQDYRFIKSYRSFLTGHDAMEHARQGLAVRPETQR